MRRIVGLATLGIVTLWLLAGCSSAVRLEVTCDDFIAQANVRREIEVPAGRDLTISLCSNPSTGFGWQDAEVSDESVLAQEDRRYVEPSDAGDRVGSAGREVWTYKAVSRGQGTIFVEYRRPWETDVEPEWTYELIVDVQ